MKQPLFSMKTRNIHYIFASVLLLSGCGSLPVAEYEAGKEEQKTASSARNDSHPGQGAIGAMTWEKKVKPGVSVIEVEETLASVAAEYNLKPVGEFKVSQERLTPSGKPERFIKIYSYCSPSVAKQFIYFSPHMAAFMPCRIALVENEDGLWLYTMNLDILLQAEQRLPPDLQSSAQTLRAVMKTLLERASKGDF